MHFAQTSAAVHFCWLTAHLYVEQMSKLRKRFSQSLCYSVTRCCVIYLRDDGNLSAIARIQ